MVIHCKGQKQKKQKNRKYFKLKFDEEPRLSTLQEMFSILSNTKIQCPVIKKVFSPDF